VALQFIRSTQRGFVKRRVGRPEEAIEDLKRAVSLDVKSREAHNHLGMALLDAGFLDQVLSPAFAGRCARAVIWIRAHQALESFEQAAELSDASFNSFLSNNKALALFRLGRKEEALACFLDALSSASSPEAAFFYNRGTAPVVAPALPHFSHHPLQVQRISSWPNGLQPLVTLNLPSASALTCQCITTLFPSRWSA
jgi:hypothetical protein